MSARMIVPKMASMMGSASVKAARPVLRTNVKTQVTARGFSGMYTSLHLSMALPAPLGISRYPTGPSLRQMKALSHKRMLTSS